MSALRESKTAVAISCGPISNKLFRTEAHASFSIPMPFSNLGRT